MITLVFSGIVAVATVIYSYLTLKLVRETKLSRELNLEAYMIAYLENSETSPDIHSLVIKNIGFGVARNLRFRIIKDIDYPDSSSLSDIGLFKKTMEYFPPNYQNKYILMSIMENFEEKVKDYLEFEITYDDAINKNKKQNFKLEFLDTEGMGKLTPPDTYIGMISYRLEKIEKLIEKKFK